MDIKNKFNKLLGLRQKDLDKNRIDEQKLAELVEEVEQEGLIDPEEHKWLTGIITFKEKLVRDIMVPRTEISAVSETASFEEVINKIIVSGHSRIPVFKDRIDTIIGIFYAKDLMRFIEHCDSPTSLADLRREPYFVPETKKLGVLLSELNDRRLHIAIVIDEFGGTSGLVTIMNLFEQIVGDIANELEPKEAMVEELEPGVELRVSGRLEVASLFERFNLDPPTGNFTTVAGWVCYHTGRIPSKGESLQIGPFNVFIEDATSRLIRRLKIKNTMGG